MLDELVAVFATPGVVPPRFLRAAALDLPEVQAACTKRFGFRLPDWMLDDDEGWKIRAFLETTNVQGVADDDAADMLRTLLTIPGRWCQTHYAICRFLDEDEKRMRFAPAFCAQALAHLSITVGRTVNWPGKIRVDKVYVEANDVVIRLSDHNDTIRLYFHREYFYRFPSSLVNEVVVFAHAIRAIATVLHGTRRRGNALHRFTNHTLFDKNLWRVLFRLVY